MTNGEKFKTAEERKVAYIRYCKDCAESEEAVLTLLTGSMPSTSRRQKPSLILSRRFARSIQRRIILPNMAAEKCQIKCVNLRIELKPLGIGG